MLVATAGYAPNGGDSFSVINASQPISGTFLGLADSSTTPISGYAFEVNYPGTSATLTALAFHGSLATAINAGNATPTTTVESGAIRFTGDSAYYQFTVTTAEQISLETFAQRLTAPPSNLNTFLTLLNSSGTTLATNNDAVGTDSKVVTALTPGTYYATVTGYGGTTGNFQLDVTAIPPPRRRCWR